MDTKLRDEAAAAHEARRRAVDEEYRALKAWRMTLQANDPVKLNGYKTLVSEVRVEDGMPRVFTASSRQACEVLPWTREDEAAEELEMEQARVATVIQSAKGDTLKRLLEAVQRVEKDMAATKEGPISRENVGES